MIDTLAAGSYTGSMQTKPKLIAILGPTASGKSSLGIQCARKTNGEIISVDSRQVYRGLDIGSGKVAKEEQAMISHHLLDVVEPGEPYSLSHFQKDAFSAINDVVSRGALPYLVGGTALYAYAVIDNYLLSETPPSESLRKELALQSLADLQSQVPKGLLNDDDYRNPRRLIRVIEKMRFGDPIEQQKSPAKYDTLLIGIDVLRDELYKKIDKRVDERVAEGMIAEIEGLRNGGERDPWLVGLGLEYRYITEFLAGEWETQDIMLKRLKGAIHAFSRRQMTWFRKDKRIHWVTSEQEATKQIERFLE